MKKTNASSDSNMNKRNHLPSEILWRAAQLINHKSKEVSPIDAEPAPQEMLGLAIGILRRRKRISQYELAQRIGCTVEEVVALETGLLPVSDYKKYLPLILRAIRLSRKSLQPFLVAIDFV